MDKGIGAAALIRDQAGRVLLVRHTYGRLNWELPGGVVERNESPSEAVVREVREETGIQTEVISLLGHYYEPAEDRLHYVFECGGNGTAPVANSAEISECQFFDSNDLPRPISDFTIRRIEDALSGAKIPLPANVPVREWFE